MAIATVKRFRGILATPPINTNTLNGAGGGSIGWIDAGGALRVGPQSAGAYPGPACYGNGGAHPTVTDADLHLGRIDAQQFSGGRITLDVEAANQYRLRWNKLSGLASLPDDSSILQMANDALLWLDEEDQRLADEARRQQEQEDKKK